MRMRPSGSSTIVAAEVAGAVPVYLGVSGSDTRKVAKTLAHTAAWPVDGYLIACPYYTRPSQEGLYRHFAALAGATERPILIYNIPYRTGVNIEQRDAAAPRRASEHRGREGLLRRPAASRSI